MCLERAMQREYTGSGRWARAVPALPIHGSARWGQSDHEALRDYLAAHETLPGAPDALPEDEVGALAARLHERAVGVEEKKRILVFLAHHGSARAAAELQRFVECADPKIRRFAELALDEALLSATPAARCLGRNDPCPCASGRKFKDCCARSLT